jgi:hypothetical protein
MKTMRAFLCAFPCAGICLWQTAAGAAPSVAVSQGEESDLSVLYDSADLIQGLIATELPGDQGWHPAVVNAEDKLPAFTDGAGILASGLTGLLNDFPGAGLPAKRIQYELRAPEDIGEIRVFTGNNGRDGRVFHTYTVRFSTDGGQTFTEPIYVQSHPSGTLNNAQFNTWRVVLSQLSEAAGPLAVQATHVEFDFYSVDNTGGQMRDPFDGPNPFTGIDDGLHAAFVSPLVWEIDVIAAVKPPALSATRVGNNLVLSWVGPAQGVAVQSTPGLSLPDWQDLNPQPVITSHGTTSTAQVVIEPGQHYFRLRF